ncbi:MAG: hypothetical protein AB1656_25615 [Candidatus Omnitrophota bacterium]
MPKSPHILLATGNCQKVRSNLTYILDSAAISAIDTEIANNVQGLFNLGMDHYNFACSIPQKEWRQRISRLYYGAYNIARSIKLAHEGYYSTETSEHKKITELPVDLPNCPLYKNNLSNLRDDRNLADYDHTVIVNDLVLTPNEAMELVTQFIADAKTFLAGKGIKI